MIKLASTVLILVGALSVAGCSTTERNLTGAALGGAGGAALGNAIGGGVGGVVGAAGGAAAGVAIAERT